MNQAEHEGNVKGVFTFDSWPPPYVPLMLDDPLSADIAHVLRRCAFGPHPDQVEALHSFGVDAVLDDLLNDRGRDPDQGWDFFGFDDESDWDEVATLWIKQIQRNDVGLHEKLVWIWHDHFAVSADKVGPSRWLWNHHLLLRHHALGNFRDLLQAVTIDAAMLEFLDGSGSSPEEPNENYAREVMELFALGRGNYTEADIRIAAQALSGWWLDWDTGEVGYDRWDIPLPRGTFLGQSGTWDTESIINRICEQDACARHIATTLHRWLLGTDPEPGRVEELAGVFRRADLEIRPLLAAIIDHPSFLAARWTRARQPIEWYTAMVVGTGYDDQSLPWSLYDLGQMPFAAPNVGGWPLDDRWLRGSNTLARASVAMWEDLPLTEEAMEADDPIRLVRERCGLYRVSEPTLSALDQASRFARDPWESAQLLVHTALLSPEFVLA